MCSEDESIVNMCQEMDAEISQKITSECKPSATVKDVLKSQTGQNPTCQSLQLQFFGYEVTCKQNKGCNEREEQQLVMMLRTIERSTQGILLHVHI